MADAVPEFPPLIVGNMARRRHTRRERVAVVHAALDAGLNTIDTAPLYDFGAAEQQLSEALAGVPRDRVQIFSKVGLRWDEAARGEVLFKHETGVVRRDSRPSSLRWQVEQSLERLGTDHLDLVQIHQFDYATPLGESLDELERLRDAGKVRAIGICNFTPAEISRAFACTKIVSLQMPYNLLDRWSDVDHWPLCNAHGVATLGYSPLAGGELIRGDVPADTQQLVARIAERSGLPINVVALAWVMSQPQVTTAIAGASTVLQIQELAAARPLAEEDAASLGRAFRASAERRALAQVRGLGKWRRRLKLWLNRLGGR